MEQTRSSNEILAYIWQQLGRSVVDKKHPFRLVTLSTTEGEQPFSRIIVLRGFQPENRKIYFYTHYYAPKIRHIEANPSIELLLYHPKRMHQLRIKGTATVHYKDSLALEHWSKIPEFRQFEYEGPIPGTPIENNGLKPIQNDDPPFFAVIVGTIDSLDWLELGRQGHVRVQFQFDASTQDWIAREVNP